MPSREDLLTQLLAQLYDRRRADPPARNVQMQKIQMPNDTLTFEETVTAAVADPASFKWGGLGVTAGWVWGAGQWK